MVLGGGHELLKLEVLGTALTQTSSRARAPSSASPTPMAPKRKAADSINDVVLLIGSGDYGQAEVDDSPGFKAVPVRPSPSWCRRAS